MRGASRGAESGKQDEPVDLEVDTRSQSDVDAAQYSGWLANGVSSATGRDCHAVSVTECNGEAQSRAVTGSQPEHSVKPSIKLETTGLWTGVDTRTHACGAGIRDEKEAAKTGWDQKAARTKTEAGNHPTRHSNCGSAGVVLPKTEMVPKGQSRRVWSNVDRLRSDISQSGVDV